MAGSTYGVLFRLTSFGESHGVAIGGVVDGMPAGVSIDMDFIQAQMDRRKPGQSALVTQRKESDQVQFLSGIFEGKSTGAPIGFMIENENSKSQDYEHLRTAYRPSHADYTWEQKYGLRDHRGGGRSSARETACRVVAGALAQLVLNQKGISILAWVDQVGHIRLKEGFNANRESIEANLVRCPDAQSAEAMEALIRDTRKNGDTLGGCISCRIEGVPVGLGEPVFDKLHAELGKAMLSINAVKGFEIGSGFAAAAMTGSTHNDLINQDGSTQSNHSGGIQGGISNGMPINLRIAFKPVATIMQSQKSINNEGETIDLDAKGRHDPCVVPRAVPIVEAMAAIVLLDFYLRQQASRI